VKADVRTYTCRQPEGHPAILSGKHGVVEKWGAGAQENIPTVLKA